MQSAELILHVESFVVAEEIILQSQALVPPILDVQLESLASILEGPIYVLLEVDEVFILFLVLALQTQHYVKNYTSLTLAASPASTSPGPTWPSPSPTISVAFTPFP